MVSEGGAAVLGVCHCRNVANHLLVLKTPEEKVEEAQNLKDQGNAFFKEGNLSKALSKYTRVSRLFFVRFFKCFLKPLPRRTFTPIHFSSKMCSCVKVFAYISGLKSPAGGMAAMAPPVPSNGWEYVERVTFSIAILNLWGEGRPFLKVKNRFGKYRKHMLNIC